MSKNALRISYESKTIFGIREFVAKVLISLKLLSRIPDRPTTTDCTIQLRSSWTEYKYLSVRGFSWDTGPVWNRSIKNSMQELLFDISHFLNICSIGEVC